MVDLADKLQVPSQVEVDEERLVRVGSYVTGRIIDLYVTLGESVNAGDPLARITSPELTQAQLAYLRASSRTIAGPKGRRACAPSACSGRHPCCRSGAARIRAGGRACRAGGGKGSVAACWVWTVRVLKELSKQGHILPSVTINVSRSGIVIGRNVIVGQVVQPSDQLFQVADLSSVWVVGDVPEQIARNVRVGSTCGNPRAGTGRYKLRRPHHIRRRYRQSLDPHGDGADDGGKSPAQAQARHACHHAHHG